MTSGLDASYRLCEAIARREAKNFYYGFLLLPPGRRRAMCALYAFLRGSDDIADEPAEGVDAAARLAHWQRRLACLESTPPDEPSIWPALADTVRRFAIPRSYLHAALDGVAMDLRPQVYATFEDLRGYCYRVASAVGLSCLHIWGYDSDGGRAEAMAEACGIALQLTNIVRDVREDAARGRVYIPAEDLARFGVAPEELGSGRLDDRLRALLEHQAERAREFYRQGLPLAKLVAPVGRPVFRTIVGIYRSLLDEIERRGYDVWTGRVSLPSWKKAAIMLGSLIGGVR
ncbi:MAG: phytoene synthase [Isosphaeraceae bacterium]|jgi:phytoene synthase|nr:MAG: phytoene synthase [Isosphaeraceae bacterium]